MRIISLGYSPCPNDTFIFYGLVHKKIDTGDLQFKEILLDVEALNQKAASAELDITKVSFHAYGNFRDSYCLLRSGGAIGKGCGPLVVAREPFSMADLKGRKIAIPGKLTTAFLLLQLCDIALGENVRIMPFHQIIRSVESGEVDAGLIIHESRFTFQEAGLKEVMDLGVWWERETGLPIPLGGIIARRSLGVQLVTEIDCLVKRSIEYSYKHPAEPKDYIKAHSQELDDEVIAKHINLYVNDYSLDSGNEGEEAIAELYRRAEVLGIIRKSSLPLFIEDL